MSPRKLLLLTAIVVLLFGFIFLFERKTATTSERETKGDLHWDLPSDRLVSIRLERADGTVELARSGAGAWRLVKPQPFPADSMAASDLARDLSQLKRVGGDSSEARPEDYGLKAPEAKATLLWTAENDPKKRESRTLELGIEIPGTDVTAARVAGQSAVLFIPTSVATAVKRNAGEFLSREVFAGSSEDATGIDLEQGRGRLLLSRREGEWWLEQPLADLADGEAVRELISDLTSIRVLDFLSASPGSLRTLGLSPPLYRVTLSDAKGGRMTVEFGVTRSDGNSVYARREGQVFTVPSSAVEELSKEAESFREPRLVRFERSRCERLEAAFGEERFLWVRGRDGGWTAGGRPVLASVAEDALTALLDLKSLSFLDESQTGSLEGRRPDAAIKASISGGPIWEVAVVASPGQAGATVSRRPGGFALSGDAIGRLRDAFRKAGRIPPRTPSPSPSPGRTGSR